MFKLEMKTKSVDHWIGENVFHIAELFSCVRGAPTLAMQGPGPAYYQVVWLASFSDGKRTATDCRVRHKWLNKEAETERHVRQTLADFDAGKSYNHFPGHQICGLALLSPRSCHHALLPLDEQMQYTTCGVCLMGHQWMATFITSRCCNVILRCMACH